MKTRIGLTALLLATSSLAAAQSYSIDWFSIAGGGTTSSGGVYSISGSIGQHDAGARDMSGGNYTLGGGFWVIVGAIQIPGAPRMTLTRADGDVILSWPASAEGYELQHNNNLALTNGWTAVVHATNVVSNQITVTVPSPVGINFYRLRKP